MIVYQEVEIQVEMLHVHWGELNVYQVDTCDPSHQINSWGLREQQNEPNESLEKLVE